LSTQEQQAVAAWARLLGAHAAMTRAFNADLQASHRLTVNDFEVLRRLSLEPGGRMRRVDLAQVVGLTPSGITRLLDGLQAAGLVRKEHCETDARVTYAALTDDGRDTLRAAAGTHLAALTAVFAERYGAEEIDRLVELLGRLPGASAAQETCMGDG
jgi:DNA-binding MarR family transcriptional regulator